MKLLANVITTAILGTSLASCKSPAGSALKDDILVKNGENAAVLYWMVSAGEDQHVCRAICPEDKIVAKGDLEETRASCERQHMESIPAQLFADNEELSAIFNVFSKELAENKVAVLSTDVANPTIKESNERRIAALNALYNDESMYLDAKVRELRDAGLVGFGQENAVRHHPACLDPKASVAPGNLATSVGKSKDVDQKQLEQPKIKADSKAMVILPKAAFDTFYSFLSEAASNPKFNSRSIISGSTSLGTQYLHLVNSQSRTMIAVSGDRGPILVDRESGQDKTLYLENPPSHAAWTQFVRAMFHLGLANSRQSGQPGFGTQVSVKKSDVQIESFLVSVSVPQGSDFSSPGEKLENTFRVTPFKQEAKKVYALQFDVVEK